MQDKKPQRPASRTLIVDRPEDVRLLASPVRDAILQTVVNHHGVSIRDIADQIGSKPGSLYRHIDALVQAGLIRESGSRKTTKRDATVYEADGDVIHLRRNLEDPASVAALQSVVAARARHAGKTAARAMGDADASTRGPTRTVNMVDLIGWLDDDQLADLNASLAAIADVFRGAARRPGTRLMAITAMLRPAGAVDAPAIDADNPSPPV